MRIALLGGAFDPIHNGHLALAEAAMDELKLDELQFVPVCKHPYGKEIVAPSRARLDMICLAIERKKHFHLNDCEIKRGGFSYTVDTLRELSAMLEQSDELFFLTGGDWHRTLSEWKDAADIFKLARVIVASRPGFDITTLPAGVMPLRFVPLDISSTDIRERVRKNETIADLVPPSVERYIRQNGFYKTQQ